MNLVNSNGLAVNTSIPQRNSQLDIDTIFENYYAFKDINTEINNPSDIKIDKLENIKGSLTYKDRAIIFKPIGQLDKYSRYIVYVPRGSIRDFNGSTSLVDTSIIFDVYGATPPCSIVSSKNNTVITSLNCIELEDLGLDKYVVKISKNKTFENMIW